MVFVLVVVVLRETEPSPDHIGPGIELHRIVAGCRQTVGRAHNVQHTLEGVLHLHARVRHHRGQLLSLVELLFARTLPGIVPTLVQLRSVRGQYSDLYLYIISGDRASLGIFLF